MVFTNKHNETDTYSNWLITSCPYFTSICMYSFPTACRLGYYASDCNNVCGKCAGNDVCDSHSGDCPGECFGNLQKPKCNGKQSHVF